MILKTIRQLLFRLRLKCGVECNCKEKLRQRALKAFDDAQSAENQSQHQEKKEHRIIAKSCMLAIKVLDGTETRGGILVQLRPRK
jgi:hypothetical protein